MKKQFIVIQIIPSPYRLHLFKVLRDELTKRGWDFHVHFMAESHGERPVAWRNPDIPFQHHCWKPYGWKTHHFNPGMLLHLLKNRPADCLLIGSAFDTFTGILATLLIPRKKSVVWTEGNSLNTGKLDGFLGWFKRLIFSHYDYVAVSGEEGRKYVCLHQQRTRRRMPERVVLPNLIDETRFKARAEGAEKRDIRRALGVPAGERLALCPARLIPVKGLIEFLTYLSPDLLGGWKLVIVGEGVLRKELENLIQARGYAERVIIKDYVSYEQMPALYAAADLFVLASVQDMNPLTVVEAMHSGLPLLLSKQVGNYFEALVEDKTGWGFSPFNRDEVVSAATAAFSASAEELSVRGRNAKLQAERFWNTEKAIHQFLASIGIAE